LNARINKRKARLLQRAVDNSFPKETTRREEKVKTIVGLLCLFCLAMPAASAYGFLAYNDCVFDPCLVGYGTDPCGNSVHYGDMNYITNYGIGSQATDHQSSYYPPPASGKLKDYTTGTVTEVNCTMSQNGGVVWQPLVGCVSFCWTGGYDTAPGTDAYSTFHNIADMTGNIYYASSAGWYVDVDFNGLNPAKTYTFATSASRADDRTTGTAGYTDRYTIYTISGVDSTTNASTSGTTEINNLSVKFNTGNNHYEGYVARWTGINPGSDGAFKIRATHAPDANAGYKAYAFDVFLLKEEPMVPDTDPPTPDPMTWASLPAASGPTSITMTATTATEPNYPPVQYYFECTDHGEANSTWQSSPKHEAQGLNLSTLYTFRVKARDSAPVPNETGWSVTGSAVTAPAPTFQAAGTAQSGTGAITVAWPTHQANDIALLFVESCGGEAVTLSTPAGFANVTNSPQATGAGTAGTRITVFWCRATSSSMSSPTVDDPGDHVYGVILTFRGVIATGDPWDVTAGGTKATASTTTTFGAVTTNVNNTLVVLAASRNNDSNAAAWTDASWANTNLSSIAERADEGTTSNNGGGVGVATGVKLTAGGTGQTTATVTSSVDGHMTIALKPPPTTLGNGSDPSNSTVAPGSTGNYLDQFTLVIASGSDLVTALTVTTANTTAIANVQIWNDAMTTQYFSTVSSPTGNNWNFSGGTAIPVTTSSASFRVIFTATSHGSLAQGTYGVTGYVSTFTSSNSPDGSDSASTTITVDNTPPSNATWGTITPGNQQVELNWSNPGDSDFSKVLILRKAGSAVTDAPTDGTEYNVNDTIGASTVRYVGNLQTFTDTGLTNGTNYYYKVFAYDTYINYASGSGTGPHTPQVTLSISVSPSTWGVGTVDKGTVQINTSGNKINVTNNGNVAETFTLQIYDEDDRDEWTHSSLKTGAGNNIYVLSGTFCATADSPTQTSFNETDSEDVLTTTQQTATSTKFAYAGGSANAVAVPLSEQRSLWLRLDMPTAVSGTYAYEQHAVTVRIGCQQ